MNLTGSIVAGYTNNTTGLFAPVFEQKNLITYAGADIVAALLNGDSRYKLSYMYFEYSNDNTLPTSNNLTRDSSVSGIQYYLSNLPNGLDYIRVPIVTDGRLSASSDLDVSGLPCYSGNILYLSATSASVTLQSNGLAGRIPFESTSKICAAALISAPNTQNNVQDKVFSRLVFSSPLAVLSSASPTIYWSVKIS